MPALAENPDVAEGLAEVVKRHFQPPPEPREVSHPEADAAQKPVPVAKPREATKPEAAKRDDPAPIKPASEPPAATEADQVFGTAAVVKPKAEAAKPADDDFETTLKKETEGMSDKAQAKWVSLRRSEKDATEKARKASEALAEREAALKEPAAPDQKSETLANRVKELEQQLADADQQLSLTKVERSAKYRREVAGPLEDLVKSAEELATRYDVEVKTALAALETTDPKERSEALAELAADFNEPDRLDLYQIGREMARLRKAGDALREKAKSDLSAVEQEEQEESNRTESERTSARAKAAQIAWDTAAREDESLRPNTSTPAWTAELEAAQRQSREYPIGKDPMADGALIARGMMLSFTQRKAAHFEAKLKEAQQENERLLARLEADGALDPDLGGNGSDALPDGDEVSVEESIGSGAKRKFGH